MCILEIKAAEYPEYNLAHDICANSIFIFNLEKR